MKKMVKIVLITFLVALPALGTYVKTTLPKLGSATGQTIEPATACTEPGDCRSCSLAVSSDCNDNKKLSKFADPSEGLSNLTTKNKNDFPVNFLFNAIPLQEELIDQPNIKMGKSNQMYSISGIL